MVTYFAKTVFTPAGLDVYSRRKGGVSQETWKAIMDQLGHVNGLGRAEGHADLGRLIGALFEVKMVGDDGVEG